MTTKLEAAINVKRREIAEKKEEIAQIKAQIENFDPSEHVSEEEFEAWLDEVYGDVEICDLKYSASYALKEVDPTAYREGFNNYCDSRSRDGDIPAYKELEERLEELEDELDSLENDLFHLEDEEE